MKAQSIFEGRPRTIRAKKRLLGEDAPPRSSVEVVTDENSCLSPFQTPPSKRALCHPRKSRLSPSPLRCWDENTMMEFPKIEEEEAIDCDGTLKLKFPPYASGWLSQQQESIEQRGLPKTSLSTKKTFLSAPPVLMSTSSASMSSSCSTESSYSFQSLRSPLTHCQQNMSTSWSLTKWKSECHETNFKQPIVQDDEETYDRFSCATLPPITPTKAGISIFTSPRSPSTSSMSSIISKHHLLQQAKDTATSNTMGFMRSLSSVAALNDQHIDECIRTRDDLQLTGDNCNRLTLPVCRHSEINYVSVHTVADFLTSKSTSGDSNEAPRLVLLDCRYPYEYSGGHIRQALNVQSDMGLQTALDRLQVPQNTGAETSFPVQSGKLLLVLHCEFSSHRAPNLARRLRSEDRKNNYHRYPYLFFPEIYVMEGGYSEFYKHYPHLCDPQGYVSMFDPAHREQLQLARQPPVVPSAGTGVRRRVRLFRQPLSFAAPFNIDEERECATMQ